MQERYCNLRIALLQLFICYTIVVGAQSLSSLPPDFVYVRDVIPGIVVDLRYYSSNNFVGDTIEGYKADKCILSKESASALNKVQKELLRQGLGIKIFDAYRPQQAVDHFVRWARDLDDTKTKSIYYPNIAKNALFNQGFISPKSGHSRGSTVDVTIIHIVGENKGNQIDMGTPWDLFDPSSWTESKSVTEEQNAQRIFLRELMVSFGFKPLKEEWWHFTLQNEPYPNTYFDFVVQ